MIEDRSQTFDGLAIGQSGCNTRMRHHDPQSDARDDDDLVLRSREGDPQALATLYRRHASALLGYLVRLCGARADAEDLLQETFLRLFQGRGRYATRGRFRAWLFTVATHLARDRMKQARRQRELAAEAGVMLAPPSTADPLEDLSRRELLEQVESVLVDLPPTYAMAFHLRVRESFSYKEIAAISGEPEGTLRSRVHHTLKRVRMALALRYAGRHEEDRGRRIDDERSTRR